ncbi:hypothetical protein [Hamadaea tsunoensis]|uniref:hypothetical protein n=1 Tax=Hamadaea tsunoensis TaxID=53368 RepID=UPI0003F863CF|nr:hypothetical protein [Hamadaea tsunoensis]
MEDEVSRLSQIVSGVLGAAPVDVLTYPTGAVAITVSREGRVAVLDGMADRSQWGVTLIRDRGYFIAGYDEIFEKLDEALEFLAQRL